MLNTKEFFFDFNLYFQYNKKQIYIGGFCMFEFYSQLSKAVDVYNENVKEEIEYYEVLEMIEDRYNEKEVMGLIIKLYSAVH